MKHLTLSLRPQNLKEVIGQDHLKPLLSKIIQTQDLSSLIFYGESGIGKTSLALILAQSLNKKFTTFNASVGLKAELITKINQNKILIIDEIHRLNKDKQDILLSYLEEKQITIYATTTENPYFKVNPAIRSRMLILQLYKISSKEMAQGVSNILQNQLSDLKMSPQVIDDLVHFSAGDYRNVLNNLVLLYKVFSGQEVDAKKLKIVIPNISFFSDKLGDAHYNNLSAFHKSLRGSDVDAALYYSALILKSGDIDGLFRRILAVAYEDVGLANPTMGIKVDAAIRAFERLGLPEGYLPIGHIICDLALSPKSNAAYSAMAQAQAIVNAGKIYNIPKHLQDNHYSNSRKLGAGIGYKYPHDFPNNWVSQSYLPQELANTHFFNYGSSENERRIAKFWQQIRKK